jgi:hypothetical protein
MDNTSHQRRLQTVAKQKGEQAHWRVKHRFQKILPYNRGRRPFKIFTPLSAQCYEPS